MILAAKDSKHPYQVVTALNAKGVYNVAPACGCGWRGPAVDPVSLGTPDTIREHLRGPYVNHRNALEATA